MSRWAEDNPIGLSLVALSAVLIIVSLLLTVVWRQPPLATIGDREAGDTQLQLDLPQLEDSEPLARYEVITDRPAFNPSRQRQVMTEVEDDGVDEDELEEDVERPEMVLSGVVITPSIRMITLQPKGTGESLVAFVGQPLEGNYGSWQVSSIEPRKATLTSGNGRTMELELQLHDIAIAAPPKPKKPETQKEKPAEEGDEPQAADEGQMTRAEEIRQRIAERREELRQAAESREDQVESETRPPNYQSAIQSMIRGGKAQKQDEDDKQN